MRPVRRVLILGAAGRDFHNFNTFFRDNPEYRVVSFTACQIPFIAERTYPPELAGERYPEGIPIHDESQLADLIEEYRVDEVVFAYSDIAYQQLMRIAALVNSCGADFKMMGTRRTMLHASKPVVSVCAVRTGCGKSQTSRTLASLLRRKGVSTVVVRHPMPYGDLRRQRCQRFATSRDLDLNRCTIEEREEYEGHIDLGHIVYAGIDYGEILKAAEREAELILWDGGNNDLPFYWPDLHIVLVDPHRPGHELSYYPGETNLRLADVVVVSKIGTAEHGAVERVKKNVREVNPTAQIVEADSVVSVRNGEQIQGRRVLVIEDGPTLTHGGMSYGAGHVAAVKYRAREIVDPRPYAVGSVRQLFSDYRQLQDVLPAMGYAEGQIAELQDTINRIPCDLVLVGTPFDLGRLIRCEKPVFRVTYELDDRGTEALDGILDQFLVKIGRKVELVTDAT